MGVISSLGSVTGSPRVEEATCSRCGRCAETCPTGVLRWEDDGIRVDASAGFGCIACGQCMMACPSNSIVVRGRKLVPEDLRELPSAGAQATPEALEALMGKRRSARKFRDQEIPLELLERIVAAAATAPMGIPPWEVGVTLFGSRAKVRELARDAADTYKGLLGFMDNSVSKLLLRVFTRKATAAQFQTFILPLAQMVVDGARSGEDKVLYDAPAALLFHTSPYADGADAFIACTYAMLMAESLGLGSCMIGCLAPPLVRRKKLLKKYGLPEGNTPKIALILGYPAVAFERGIRRTFQSVNAY